MTQREDKLAQLYKRLAADFLQAESNQTSLITVTDARVSGNLRQVTIYITVLPESAEEQALAFANRKQIELRNYAKSRSKTRVLPFFTFEIDKGEKHRQRIDELLR